jgi:hypothetical protein
MTSRIVGPLITVDAYRAAPPNFRAAYRRALAHLVDLMTEDPELARYADHLVAIDAAELDLTDG